MDDHYEYRHVILPKEVYRKMPRNRILTENVSHMSCRNGDLWEFNNQEAGSTMNCTDQSPTFFSSEDPKEPTPQLDFLLPVLSLLPTPSSTDLHHFIYQTIKLNQSRFLNLGSNFLTLKVFKIELSVITLVYIEPSITTPKIMRILRRVLIVVQSKVLVPNLLLSTSYYSFGKSRILICQLENHSFHFVNATFALDGLIIFVTAD